MSIKLTSDDETLRQSFQALKTRDDLALLLDVSPQALRYYLYKAKKYKTFLVQKRSGGTRTISSPDNALKLIQKKLNQVLQAVYQGRSPVHGFARARSIKTNAVRHLGSTLVLNFDLADFFPTIHFGRVRGLFQAKPYNLPEPVALALAQVCCNAKVLPAGAPTSPVVSNMLCAQMDAQLKAVATRHSCAYTRYVDDMTISTRHDRFHPAIAFRNPNTKRWVVGDKIRDVVGRNLFAINDAKTRVGTNSSRQEVTGLGINVKLNVHRRFVRQVRAMLHAWQRYGEPGAEAEFVTKFDRKQRSKAPSKFREVLRGKVEFIGFVRGRDDALYVKLLMWYARLAQGCRVRPIIAGSTTSDAVLAQAIWLLLGENDDPQGTAFAAEGFGLLTAAHCVSQQMYATRPGFDDRRYLVNIVRRDEDHDVAQLSIDNEIPIQLPIGRDDTLRQGTPITLLGFPLYHVGDQVAIRRGPITQSRVYFAVQHFVIEPVIVVGNSGGPILNAQNQVGNRSEGVEHTRTFFAA